MSSMIKSLVKGTKHENGDSSMEKNHSEISFTGWEFSKPETPLKKVEKKTEPLQPGHVRIKVHACGICHSDVFTEHDAMKGGFPRCPGHEVAGEVVELGDAVKTVKVGDRVGVGWYGGHCGECKQCFEGNFVCCQSMPVTGIHYDGGYQQYMTAPKEALAPLPSDLSYVEAAPLLCAGVTVYNALRKAGAMPGDNVGIQGVGGLGHLAIQFANKMGYKVFVLSRGDKKKDLAMELGAHVYIDIEDPEYTNKVQAEGGCKVILGTGTAGKAMSDAIQCLSVGGTFVICGVAEDPVPVIPTFMVVGMRKVHGHASGSAADSTDCLKFCALSGVRSRNEVYPASKAPEAYERMTSGQARFRVVLNWDE